MVAMEGPRSTYVQHTSNSMTCTTPPPSILPIPTFSTVCVHTLFSISILRTVPVDRRNYITGLKPPRNRSGNVYSSMGQGASSTSGTPFPSVALHVLRVAELSPAHQAGIQPFFDYLIGVEILRRRPLTGESGAVRGQGIDEEIYEEAIGLSLDPEELARVLEENEEKEIGLRVYNAKSQRVRCE
jgi:hypothetical protein